MFDAAVVSLSATDFSVEFRRERLTDRDRARLYEKFVRYARNGPAISVHPYVHGADVLLSGKGRGARVFFTSEQSREAVAALSASRNGAVWNGMTGAALSWYFKCDAFHEMGRGYFHYPAKPVYDPLDGFRKR